MTAPPCVNCGFCCKKAPCHEAYKVFTDDELRGRFGSEDHPGCPALLPQNIGGGYVCGLVVNATGAHLDYLIESLSIGAGSCASMNSARQRRLTIEQRKEEAEWRRNPTWTAQSATPTTSVT